MAEAEAGKEEKLNTRNRILRLIAALAAGLIIGAVIAGIAHVACAIMFNTVPAWGEGGSWSDLSDYVDSMLTFSGLFWGLVIGIRIVTKKSMKTFILGEKRTEKVSIGKEVLPVLGLYLMGILIMLPFSWGKIEFTGKSTGKILFLIIFSMVFAWMQTSWEELLFRGLPFRLVCGEKIGMNKAAIITGIVTSLIFMACHIPNDEVQTLSGIQAVFQTLGYFVAGFGFYLCDILTGDLLPGLLIHWINNFYAFVIICGAVSSAGISSIWIDTTEASGVFTFVCNLVAFVPVVIYLFIRWKKKNGSNLNV